MCYAVYQNKILASDWSKASKCGTSVTYAESLWVGPGAVAEWLATSAPNLWTWVQSLVPPCDNLDESFILATSAIPLITVVPACLLGLT